MKCICGTVPLLLFYSAQFQGRVGGRTSISQEQKRKNTVKEGEQYHEEKEKEEDEDVKGQTKWEKNKERVDRVTETFI